MSFVVSFGSLARQTKWPIILCEIPIDHFIEIVQLVRND